MRDFNEEISRPYAIPNKARKILAARAEIHFSKGDIEEYFNPDTNADRKAELLRQLKDDLFEAFQDLGHILAGDPDIGGELFNNIMLGVTNFNPAKFKGNILPFVEIVLRRNGISRARKSGSEKKRAREGYEAHRSELEYTNALARFLDDFPLAQIVEREIPNLPLEADQKFVKALLDYLKEFNKIPTNKFICSKTQFSPAHVATRLKIVKKHLRGVILAEVERMEGVDIDTLHLAL